MELIKNLYTQPRLYWALSANVALFLLGLAFPVLLAIATPALLLLAVVFLTDLLMLFGTRQGVQAHRICAPRFSNGDDNPVSIKVGNRYRFPIQARVIDELPVQFQERNFLLESKLQEGKTYTSTYQLKPVRRGEYLFGLLNVFAIGPIGLIARRYRLDANKMVPVYPSFLQMRKYELMAISNRLTEIGVKRIRKLGHNMEFDQIREYVLGDDYRAVNWNATARRNALMVNQYQDERSQQVFCMIDKGRAMQMPFEGMTLLDYAINASLVLSNIAVQRQDKAGLVTFNTGVRTWLAPSNKRTHINTILESLYAEKTAFKESDYERLYINIKRRISQRSLLLLFTNFETLSGLERQLKYFRRIAQSHLLVVVFFENTELKGLVEKETSSVEDIYLHTIAEKFAYEKRLIAKELQKYGIFSIYTSPQNLTVNTINKYLELKARGLI